MHAYSYAYACEKANNLCLLYTQINLHTYIYVYTFMQHEDGTRKGNQHNVDTLRMSLASWPLAPPFPQSHRYVALPRPPSSIHVYIHAYI